jgi:hypothetical protein
MVRRKNLCYWRGYIINLLVEDLFFTLLIVNILELYGYLIIDKIVEKAYNEAFQLQDLDPINDLTIG